MWEEPGEKQGPHRENMHERCRSGWEWNLQPSGFISVIHTCRNTAAQEEEEEEQEEVTGSLLRGGAVGGRGGGDVSGQEEEVCPPLLPVSPSLHRAQSSLHSINLSVQQVSWPDEGNTRTTEKLSVYPPTCLLVCPGEVARCLWKRRQWEILNDLQYLGAGKTTSCGDTLASCEVTSYFSQTDSGYVFCR